MNRRFSISRLMVLVLIVAVGLGAAMAGAFTFAVVVLSAATLCGVLRRGSGRAFFLGSAGFGWAAMLLAFGTGREFQEMLPTRQPIARLYVRIYGPGPTTFQSPEEAERWILQTVQKVNSALTTGHSLIALFVALIGGLATWLIARLLRGRAGAVPV